MTRSFDDLAARVAASWDEDVQALYAAASKYFSAQLRSRWSPGEREQRQD